MTPPQEIFLHPLNGTEHGSHPSLTTRDRELVSVLEVRIEPGDGGYHLERRGMPLQDNNYNYYYYGKILACYYFNYCYNI